MQNFNNPRIFLFLAVLFSAPVGAQPVPQITLKDAAQAAVLKSPEVQARWHAFRESTEEIGVASGGFLPKVDLSAGIGHQKTEQRQAGTNLSYSGNETTLTLRQMLFDGFATSNEVKRLGKAKLVRYFELLDASENAALEAGRAYLDVIRFRNQVELAEENYLQHQAAYEQLKKRAESGVGKRVDVDQASSRLALADVNLTTAYANLHDVSARYLRIVGEQPARQMPLPDQLSAAVPRSVDAALAESLKHNPALRASVENIEASQYDLEARRAAMMPRVDLIARRDDYSNYQDAGNRNDNRIELRLNFNLFNGGSDSARNRQYRERKNIALDQREKACRDIRQTLAIAFNETLRLKDQITFIATQVRLVEKTRAAYRDQFNIGQRTLLDLLNTQNEYFDARRAQVNADADLAIAYLRTYGSMGNLLETLGLKHIEAEDSPTEGDLTPIDLAQLCPATTPLDTTLDREALARKVKDMLDNQPSSFLGNRPKPAEPSTLAPAVNNESEVSARIAAWRSAWVGRDVRGYLEFYAPGFKPENGTSREDWARQRSMRLSKADGIGIDIQDLVVRRGDADTMVTSFRQIYTASHFSDTSEKTLEWRKEGGQWLIVRESSRPVNR